jgi:hypothetical protein
MCGPTRTAWHAFIAAAFGELMDAEQFQIFQQCTGRMVAPTEPASALWLGCGRGAGKSEIVSFLAVYLACFKTYTPSPGEKLVGMVLAADRKQARVIIRYIKAMLHGHPMLEGMIARHGSQFEETAQSVTLKNGIDIEVHTSNFRSVRGYTIPFALADEIAFWEQDDTANPDKEVITALRPGMGRASLGPRGGLFVALSSTYAQRGELYRAFTDHYGRDGDPVLFWRAPTLVMNPTYSKETIDQAYEEDPVAAAAEYGAEFRSDVQTLFDPQVINGCQMDEAERPPAEGVRYRAFIDPAGGSGQDSMTMAIGHTETQADLTIDVIDCIREFTPPFSPDDSTREIAGVLKRYRLTSAMGDRFAGEWPRERFRAHGIEYKVSPKSKSEIYLEFIPPVNSGRVRLPRNQRMRAQMASLVRHTSRGGRDTIDHPPRAHDDVINAVAGAIVMGGSSGVEYRVRTV